jgi:hypothetical protein
LLRDLPELQRISLLPSGRGARHPITFTLLP